MAFHLFCTDYLLNRTSSTPFLTRLWNQELKICLWPDLFTEYLETGLVIHGMKWDLGWDQTPPLHERLRNRYLKIFDTGSDTFPCHVCGQILGKIKNTITKYLLRVLHRGVTWFSEHNIHTNWFHRPSQGNLCMSIMVDILHATVNSEGLKKQIVPGSPWTLSPYSH